MLDESKELRKLIDHYEERAEHWYREYMDSGLSRHETAYYRNQHMAEALTAALKGKDTRESYYTIKQHVMALDTTDEQLSQRVALLQKWISEGQL